MATEVTVTLILPGRSRKDALRKAGAKLTAAAWEDYPDRIATNRNDGDLGYANALAARCDLLQTLGEQFTKAADGL